MLDFNEWYFDDNSNVHVSVKLNCSLDRNQTSVEKWLNLKRTSTNTENALHSVYWNASSQKIWQLWPRANSFCMQQHLLPHDNDRTIFQIKCVNLLSHQALPC